MALFSTSLLLPGYYTESYLTQATIATLTPLYGLELLVFGFLEMFFHGFSAWLANPVMVIYLILALGQANRKWLLLTSMSCVLLTLSFAGYASILVNEAGGRSPVAFWGAGYFCWIGTAITLFIHSCLVAKEPQVCIDSFQRNAKTGQ